MNENSSHQYDQDEVSRIIRRALKIKNEDKISHQDLIETAKEMGLDPKIMEAAIEQELREIKKTRTRMASLKRRRMCFFRNLSSYIIVIGMLALINFLTPGPWWFQWPALGWGIGLVFQLKTIFFHSDKNFDEGIKTKHTGTGRMMCEP